MARLFSIWLLVATTTLAQETPSPAATKNAPPTEDAIAAAKREFNAIKSTRGALEQSKVELPSVSAPELQTTAPMPRIQSTSKLDPKAAKKSSNWLVDAMMKSDERESRNPRESTSEATRRGRVSDAIDDTTDPLSETDPRQSASKDQDLPMAEKRVGPEFNPLTRYMAGWMSPQDYALLKPGMDGAAAASLTSRGDPSLPSVGADLSLLGDTGSALDLSTSAKAAPFALPKPADNPFLQSLNLSGGTMPPAFAPPPAPASASAPAGPAPVQAEVAPPRSRIPDFAKPATDEKYFKQLKRF